MRYIKCVCYIRLFLFNTILSFLVAEARYNDIVHAEDAWDIDEDALAEGELRPTKSAEKLIDLLELITSNTLITSRTYEFFVSFRLTILYC